MEDYLPEKSVYSKIKAYAVSIIKIKKISIPFLLFLFILGGYLFLQRPPREFPLGQVVTVYPGESLQEITNTLYEEKIIRSKLLFRTTVILLSGEKRVMAGDYLLNKKNGAFDIANRLVNGQFNIEVIKITIPEGWSISQIADYLENNLINFDRQSFVNLAKKEEGYLFPDTYFISPAMKIDKLIDLMKDNFNNRVLKLAELEDSEYSLKEIITMASILEGEAITTDSRKIVSGILWKRLDLGMPLQVDATFSYVNGKNTYELTTNDLQIDSPYNTYKYRGLPPTPINNPGLDAIKAALNPTTTKYLYFLSSRDGKMYYAENFEQHKKNRELYLDK